jgi:alpha-amylase
LLPTRSLTGYAHVVYGSDRTSATVTVRTYTRTNSSCFYSFNGDVSYSSEYQATSALTSDLNITATCTDSSTDEEWTLTLDPVNFVWQSNTVTQPSGMNGGQKGAIVDLFGWPYDDIAQECSDFLGKAGYMGVKINPPQESVLSDVKPQSGQRNPWYFVYQPVSYRLYSRLGSRSQLRSMIQTCRANGVRVYADAVVNHMTGAGNDILNHRSDSSGTCYTWVGTSSSINSPYFTFTDTFGTNDYTGYRAALEYPAVPFNPSDFHCQRSITSWDDALQLQYGWLSSLTDLNTGKTYVRERIAQYFVDLMGIGFSGLRVDALKHIGPDDFAAIMGLFNTYMGGSLPEDFLEWGEVGIGGEADMLACNADSGYNFYEGMDALFASNGISTTDIAKLKIWSSDYPTYMPACGSWILPASRFVVQNDDHDQQFDSTARPMGSLGSVLVTAKDVDTHRGFEVNLFKRTDADWQIKVVLSSYTLFDNGAAGFPDGYSDCSGSSSDSCTLSVPYEKAFQSGSCGYTVEDFAGGKYTRVHRDLSIVNAMRSWVGLTTTTYSDLGITGSC